jgi:hypothetical protein
MDLAIAHEPVEAFCESIETKHPVYYRKRDGTLS